MRNSPGGHNVITGRLPVTVKGKEHVALMPSGPLMKSRAGFEIVHVVLAFRKKEYVAPIMLGHGCSKASFFIHTHLPPSHSHPPFSNFTMFNLIN